MRIQKRDQWMKRGADEEISLKKAIILLESPPSFMWKKF
jgi:hypothetical protein